MYFHPLPHAVFAGAFPPPLFDTLLKFKNKDLTPSYWNPFSAFIPDSRFQENDALIRNHQMSGAISSH
jgi:hypothetical protein